MLRLEGCPDFGLSLLHPVDLFRRCVVDEADDPLGVPLAFFSLTATGALTANRNGVVPNNWQGIVFCNNSGAFTTTFKTSAGTGVVVAQGKRALLVAEGTNVVRVTPDT